MTISLLSRWRSRDLHVHPALIAGLLGAALSLAVYTAVVRYWDRPNLQEELNALGESRRLLIQGSLMDVEQVTDSFAHHFESLAGEPHPVDLVHCTDKLGLTVGSTALLGWIPKVPRQDRVAHEARMALDGLGGYYIGDVGPSGQPTPAAGRDAYFPLAHTCGTGNIFPSVGFDLGAIDAFRQALDRARDSGEPVASSRVSLPNVTGPKSVVLLAAPAYRTPLPYKTIEERRLGLSGFAVAIFNPSLLLDSILSKVRSPQGLDVQFFDSGSGPNDPAFHVRSSLLRTVPAEVRTRRQLDAGWHWTGRLEIGGMHWDMVVVTIPNAPLLYKYNRAWIILIAGLSLTGTTIAYTWSAYRINSRLGRTRAQLAIATTIAEKSPVVLGRWRLPISGPGPDGPIPEYLSANLVQFGYRAEELLSGKVNFLRDIVHPDDCALVTDSIAASIDSGMPEVEAEIRLVRKDGKTRWVEWHMRLEHDAANNAIRGEGTLRDITEQKAAEDRMQFANFLLASEIEAWPGGVVSVQADSSIATFNQRFLEMWSIPRDVADHHDANAILATILPQLKDQDAFRARVLQIREHPEHAIQDEIELKDGRIFEFHFAGMQGQRGQYIGRINFFRDVTDRKRLQDLVAHQAHFDALTGLPNRLDFDATLEKEIARCRRYDRPFCLSMGDIDHFKLVNDTFGHQAGDAVLEALGRNIREGLRNADYIARWGGEEFAILLPETHLQDAEELLNRLRVAIANRVIPEIGRSITLSFGLTAFAKSDSRDDLIGRVDRALYTAKETGRNRVAILPGPAANR
jgi:diguanylate cyclase (GGDEF)-like protein/PAS domain S-box-containing protein